MKYRIVKTNKKSVTKEFNDLDSLYDYSEKNRYIQGHAELYVDGVKIDLGVMSSVYGVFSWSLNQSRKG